MANDKTAANVLVRLGTFANEKTKNIMLKKSTSYMLYATKVATDRYDVHTAAPYAAAQKIADIISAETGYRIYPQWPVAPGIEEDQPTLKRGSKGAEVKDWQKWLNANGFDAGAVDGDFGPQTEAAVKRFQAAAKISADGIIGPVTWGARESWEGGPGLVGGVDFARLFHEALILARRGVEYVYGAEVSPATPPEKVGPMDCSEMTEYLFARAGFKIPDGSINQYHASSAIGKRKPTLGDLGFQGYIVARKVKTTHVVLVLSENTIVEAVGGATRRVRTKALSSVESRSTFLGWFRPDGLPLPGITKEKGPVIAPIELPDKTPGDWGIFEPIRKLIDKFLALPLIRKITQNAVWIWEHKEYLLASLKTQYDFFTGRFRELRADVNAGFQDKTAEIITKINRATAGLVAEMDLRERSMSSRIEGYRTKAKAQVDTVAAEIRAKLNPVATYLFGPVNSMVIAFMSIHSFLLWLKSTITAEVKLFFRDPVEWQKEKFLLVLDGVISAVFESLCWFADRIW